MEKNLGHATAYGYAKSKGYSGTEDEFAELMADYASVGQSAAQSAEQAAASATSASGSAATASQAAQTATTKASDAIIAEGVATAKAEDAQAYATSANQSAESASTSAQTATAKAGTATAKADEAAASEAAALSAKTDAESARDAAAQSASAAAESARTLTIDATLTQSGQAADSKVVGDENARTRSKMQLITPDNLLNASKLTVGYITANGTISDNDNYRFTDFIPVVPGEILSFWRSKADGTTVDASINSRFCCAFDSDKAKTTGGVDANISTFTVPDGVAYMRFTFLASYFSYTVLIKKGTAAPMAIQPYFDPYYAATPDFMPYPFRYKKANTFHPNDGTVVNIYALNTNVVKNVLYVFDAKISNFSSITIGQGFPNGNYRSYVTVDSTNLTFNVNGSDYTYAHGLTIADYLKITIDVNNNTKAKVTIFSGGASFSKTLGWYGFGTSAYHAVATTGSFHNVAFSVVFKDITNPVYIFGDSYTAILESTAKWTHWLVVDGYDSNTLINAYPGEDGANALSAFEHLLLLGKPKYLLWCLGMNDGADSENTPNTSWMSAINSVLALCEKYGIIPVLATIPTVPTINHEAKNAWVRESGYRYVDFAKAVGASDSGVWYDGMLAQDGVHPTETGAKALYHRVLCDFPEITMN